MTGQSGPRSTDPSGGQLASSLRPAAAAAAVAAMVAKAGEHVSGARGGPYYPGAGWVIFANPSRTSWVLLALASVLTLMSSRFTGHQ